MRTSCVLSLILHIIYMTHSNVAVHTQEINNQERREGFNNEIALEQKPNANNEGSLLLNVLKRVRREPKQSKKKMKAIRKDLLKRGLPPRSTPTCSYLYRFKPDHLLALPWPYVNYDRAIKMNSIGVRKLTMPYGSTLNKTIVTFFTIDQKRKWFKGGGFGGANRKNLNRKGGRFREEIALT